jgi:hypothetical protein
MHAYGHRKNKHAHNGRKTRTKIKEDKENEKRQERKKMHWERHWERRRKEEGNNH